MRNKKKTHLETIGKTRAEKYEATEPSDTPIISQCSTNKGRLKIQSIQINSILGILHTDIWLKITFREMDDVWKWATGDSLKDSFIPKETCQQWSLSRREEQGLRLMGMNTHHICIKWRLYKSCGVFNVRLCVHKESVLLSA